MAENILTKVKKPDNNPSYSLRSNKDNKIYKNSCLFFPVTSGSNVIASVYLRQYYRKKCDIIDILFSNKIALKKYIKGT